ncbi:hypothetical protein T4B_14559 [Trichinella pseudospiralis]|uniref:Uncharacterized protein n=1 Tax=Trichinella pseudospiralis TaxID=6337 RepID=A0A0V1JIZ0_TRIPS|nr:hypothetical protein T4B_14559 [Trichinella pseudospiralis]KRZ44015.1 hypothetical protein T4C_5396 [Trichinella pseudospiralis]
METTYLLNYITSFQALSTLNWQKLRVSLKVEDSDLTVISEQTLEKLRKNHEKIAPIIVAKGCCPHLLDMEWLESLAIREFKYYANARRCLPLIWVAAQDN